MLVGSGTDPGRTPPATVGERLPPSERHDRLLQISPTTEVARRRSRVPAVILHPGDRPAMGRMPKPSTCPLSGGDPTPAALERQARNRTPGATSFARIMGMGAKRPLHLGNPSCQTRYPPGGGVGMQHRCAGGPHDLGFGRAEGAGRGLPVAGGDRPLDPAHEAAHAVHPGAVHRGSPCGLTHALFRLPGVGHDRTDPSHALGTAFITTGPELVNE